MDRVDVAIVTHAHPDHMEAVQKPDKWTMFGMNAEEHRFINEFTGRQIEIPEPYFFFISAIVQFTASQLNILWPGLY
jgi:glyoxylase-like metal-dependent hydrolase (beta-lactamase superfamily II)